MPFFCLKREDNKDNKRIKTQQKEKKGRKKGLKNNVIILWYRITIHQTAFWILQIVIMYF